MGTLNKKFLYGSAHGSEIKQLRIHIWIGFINNNTSHNAVNINQLAVSNQNTSTSTKHRLRIRELDSRQRPLDEIKTDFTERHFKRCPKNHCDKDSGEPNIVAVCLRDKKTGRAEVLGD